MKRNTGTNNQWSIYRECIFIRYHCTIKFLIHKNTQNNSINKNLFSIQFTHIVVCWPRCLQHTSKLLYIYLMQYCMLSKYVHTNRYFVYKMFWNYLYLKLCIKLNVNFTLILFERIKTTILFKVSSILSYI